MGQYHVIIANWYTVHDCPNIMHSRRSRGEYVVPDLDYEPYNNNEDYDDDLAATETTQFLKGERRVRYADGYGDCWTFNSCVCLVDKGDLQVPIFY
jgi:hypothetical protein